MADSKITALTAISTVDPTADPLVIVDVSDTSMAASGTTKKSTINQLLGSGGTATLASATITGAATVGTTLGVTSDLTVGTSPFALKVFPATNRVLINQAAAIQGDALEISAKTNGGAISLFGRASDNLATIAFRSNGAATQKGAIYCNDTGFEFVTGASTLQQTINSSTGDVTVSTGNLVMGTSGKGIDFTTSADGTGTVTAELLNDYEEGTWTPVVADATTGGNVGTCTINSATYTKIGRQVSIQCDLRSITTTGMTGGNNLFIRGLPFASVKGGNGSFYTYRVGRNASTVSSAVTVEHGVSHAFLSLFTTSSANTNLSILVSDITSGTSELALSVTYTV